MEGSTHTICTLVAPDEPWVLASRPLNSPLPHWHWAWTHDLLWPKEYQQMWHHGAFISTYLLGLTGNYVKNPRRRITKRDRVNHPNYSNWGTRHMSRAVLEPLTTVKLPANCSHMSELKGDQQKNSANKSVLLSSINLGTLLHSNWQLI